MKKRIRIGVGLLATLVLAVVVAALQPERTSAAPGDNAIVHWSGIAEAAIIAPTPPATTLRAPAGSAVLSGMVHGAMYDAVAAVEGGLKPFATGVTAPPDSSADAAVATAAKDVLVARVPLQAGTVQTAYTEYMALIPDGAAKARGTAVGAAAAAGMIAMRLGDGFDDAVPFVQPTKGPGVFEPIATTPVVTPGLGKVRPFTMGSPSDYRPDPPYALNSKRYAEDVAELTDVGRFASTTRTAKQTETVLFHTAQTYAQFNRTLRELATAKGFDLRESARLLGYFNVAAADTMIACWEAKYHYMFWRPNHAIQRADTDGNPATTKDETWLPRIVGNHPEYPSGHTCFTAAFTESVRSYFGTKHVELTIASNAVGAGLPRTYESVDELVEDVENARVWGGLHYRTTMTEGAKHFPQIARDIGKQHFLVKAD